MIGIYKITDKEDSTIFYVGKSNNIERRFREHQYKTASQSRIPFDDYITKKGKDNFIYEVLEECSLEDLNEKERYWIEKLKAKDSGNFFDGGLSDVVGEHNPNAKITEADVIFIRKAYANHEKQKDVYEHFKEKISFNHFQNIWQGRVWSHIMPEVFTEENKQYYIYQNSKGANGAFAKLTEDEVIQCRQRYVNESAKDIYKEYQDKITYQAFQQMLWGKTYKDLPIYKKKEKRWINV